MSLPFTAWKKHVAAVGIYSLIINDFSDSFTKYRTCNYLC